MPQAILVTKQNLAFILDYAAQLGFNLDYLPDNVEYNAELFGEATYLITDGTPEKRNVTFTEMSESGFYQDWKFADVFSASHFTKIERV